MVGVDLSPADARPRPGPPPRSGTGRGRARAAGTRPRSSATWCSPPSCTCSTISGVGLAEAARVLVPSGRVVIVHGRSVHDPDDIEAALAPAGPAAQPARGLGVRGERGGPRRRGCSPVADTMTGKVLYEESPDQVADRFEERVWSFLWRVDDDDLGQAGGTGDRPAAGPAARVESTPPDGPLRAQRLHALLAPRVHALLAPHGQRVAVARTAVRTKSSAAPSGSGRPYRAANSGTRDGPLRQPCPGHRIVHSGHVQVVVAELAPGGGQLGHGTQQAAPRRVPAGTAGGPRRATRSARTGQGRTRPARRPSPRADRRR